MIPTLLALAATVALWALAPVAARAYDPGAGWLVMCAAVWTSIATVLIAFSAYYKRGR